MCKFLTKEEVCKIAEEVKISQNAGKFLYFFKINDFKIMSFDDFLGFILNEFELDDTKTFDDDFDPEKDTQEALDFLFYMGAVKTLKILKNPDKIYYFYNLKG